MLTQSERSKSKFILLKFIYLKNFNNLHVKHENLTKMKMGFFFHFFFFVYHAHVDMTVEEHFTDRTLRNVQRESGL